VELNRDFHQFDPDRPVEARLALLTRRHYGYATTAELREAGLSDDAIFHRARAGRLHRRHRGVYAIGYPRLEPVALAAAAVLAGGPGAVLSHGSAAALWGLRREWPDPPEATSTGDRRGPGITWHRTTVLTLREIRHHLGIRTTSAARAVLDLAPRLGDPKLARMLNGARIARWLYENELLELCRRRLNHPGSARIRALLGDSDSDSDRKSDHGPTRSVLEDVFPVFARAYEMPDYRANARVAGFEVDILFAAERVIVELDGWEFHRGHTQFTGDRDRDAATLEAGYVTVRLIAAMLAPGAQAATARRLHAILARRRHELA
jgi:very-short-patch-repair endonuclease